MKKTKIISLLFCLAAIQLSAQNRTADRQELQNLLQERKEKFDAYAASLEKRSGIFGGKTKNDMQRSNEVLTEIVRTDNRIISTLNRVADFKTFEKVNLEYDFMKNNEQLNNLRHAVDTLNKQVSVLTVVNSSLKSRTQNLQWLVYGLLFLMTVMVIITLRNRHQ